MNLPRRHQREAIVKPTQQADLTNRTPTEIVQAVNTAIGSESVVAARKLPSGDTVLTFAQDAEGYTRDKTWVTKAFGPEATLRRREYAVIAKGLPASRLRQIHRPEELLKALQKKHPAVARCRIQLPRSPHQRFAEVVLHTTNALAANQLCQAGVIFEAQIFNAEPYYADIRVRRCFRCHTYGHIGRYCKRRERCGRCAGAKHDDPEGCPAVADPKLQSCLNCKGSHVAWDRHCPIARKEQARARQAYLYRPTRFNTYETEKDTSSPDGFQEVSRKRRARAPTPPAVAIRGRPTALRQAARSSQSIRDFTSPLPTQDSTAAASAAGSPPGTQFSFSSSLAARPFSPGP